MSDCQSRKLNEIVEKEIPAGETCLWSGSPMSNVGFTVVNPIGLILLGFYLFAILLFFWTAGVLEEKVSNELIVIAFILTFPLIVFIILLVKVIFAESPKFHYAITGKRLIVLSIYKNRYESNHIHANTIKRIARESGVGGSTNFSFFGQKIFSDTSQTAGGSKLYFSEERELLGQLENVKEGYVVDQLLRKLQV